MSSSSCYIELGDILTKISKRATLLADSGKFTPEVKEALSDVLKGYRDAMDEIKLEKVTDELLDTIDENIHTDILHILDMVRAGEENTKFISDLLKLGSSNKQGILEKINTFAQRTRNLLSRESLWYFNQLERVFEGLSKRDQTSINTNTRTYKAFLNHIRGGNKFIEILKSRGLQSAEEQSTAIAQALKNGHYEGISELHALGQAFREMDSIVQSRRVANGVPGRPLQKYVAPINENRERLLGMTKEVYRKLAIRSFNFDKIFHGKDVTPGKINAWIDRRFVSKTEATEPGISSVIHKREVVFLDDTAELNYLRATSKEGQDLIRTAFSHQIQVLTKSKLYELHGPNIKSSMEAVEKVITQNPEVRNILKSDTSRFVANNLALTGRKAGIVVNPISPTDEITNTWINIISNYSSAALTTWSGLRQILYDGPMHAAFQTANIKGTNLLMEVARKYSAHTAQLFKRGETNKLAAFYEDHGIGIALSTNHLTQGLEQHARIFRESKLDRATHSLAENMNKANLSDWTLRTQRAYEAQQTSSLINRALSGSLDELKISDPDIYRYIVESGISPAQFEALRKLPKLKFDGSDTVLDFSAVDAAPRKALQTGELAISSLKDAYINLHTRMLDDFITVLSLRGTPSESINIGKHPLGLLIYKFWGMPLSQYRSWLRLTRAASGLDPDASDVWGLVELGKTWKGRARLAQFMMAGQVAGHMYFWSRDLMQGKDPRDISPMTIAQSLAFTGAGGVAAMIMQDLYFNSDVIGSPVGLVADATKSIGKATLSETEDSVPRALHKTSKKLIPGLNLWLAPAAYDKLFYDGLGYGQTRRDKTKDKERGNEYFILDD